MLTLYLESEFADAPELRAHVIPDYPPLAKRMLLDNGTWARDVEARRRSPRDRCHRRDHRRRRDDGRTVAQHEVDVIVYATGFQASRFLTPMRVVGRDGRDLHDHWDGDARAYLGITVPGFPNFFCLYGPNTNLVANGSIIFFSECTVGYIVECVRLLLAEHKRALDTRVDAYEAYNDPDRRGQCADGVGRVGCEQLVQERRRTGHAELAGHAPRVLGTDARRRIPRSTNCSSSAWI